MKQNFYFFRVMRMMGDLDEIRKKVGSVEELAIRSLRIIQRCLLDFKEHAMHHDFETKAEEMLFFKVIKPELSSYRIFFMELFNWWKDRPKESKIDVLKAYWEDKIKVIDAYRETHRQFLKAWEADVIRCCVVMMSPENSDIFRQREVPGDRTGNSYFDEPRSSGSDDEITATLMAYERLAPFCLRQIELLSRVNDNRAGSEAVNAE
jgi:hypothetical protein